MRAGSQQCSVSGVSRVAVDSGGAEGAAENSEPALQLRSGRRKVRPVGSTDQQSLLRLLCHHRVAVSTPHLRGVEHLEM